MCSVTASLRADVNETTNAEKMEQPKVSRRFLTEVFLALGALIIIVAMIVGGSIRQSAIQKSCDEFGAVKIGYDVYECKKEVGVT